MDDGLDDESFVDADRDRWFTDEYGDKGHLLVDGKYEYGKRKI